MLVGSDERSLHHAYLSMWTGTLFVALEVASICKPFLIFGDRMGIFFLEFGCSCDLRSDHCIMQTCRCGQASFL